ncbi:hypothetical protein GCK72_010447 [Caenorhabditis remanei]|uniref:ELYS beta-propeller domain-containing protein n=1 Tax=Caenorhabditis remanei TaxID=31234 RepID=A0A6A5H558_CAERE|nr:hypothetical protein GCK72_010447 [Caenorhabditis remanei]KAF1762185.1 hypothetical protein GCK72_010447 [Caenorhabditis remanei]
METSSIFKPYLSYDTLRGDKQTMLKNSIGRQLPYIINFKENSCQVFDIELERITHIFTFPDSCHLVVVDYFPTADGQFGIIVGIEDKLKTWGSENFVVALAVTENSPRMVITHSIEVPDRITVIKTLFSNVDMAEGKEKRSLQLYHRLLSWPHVIAIGCKGTKCFLSSLQKTDESQEVPAINTPKKPLLDLLACYVENDNLRYSNEDGTFREYTSSGVYVSALALMPRSRTLLVGLSMGGILAATLNASNQMNLIELRHERLIHAIAPLEPEDDPDKFEYFIAAVDRDPRHSIMIQLWRGSFKSSEEVSDDEKYDRPQYNVCLEHKIPYGERWLSVKTIVTERGVMDGVVQRRRNDSSMDSTVLNVTQSFGCTSDRSNVFLAYERRKPEVINPEETMYIVEAAIFDIDAWYYKRVPGRVTTDGLSLRQSPFMSCIRSDINSIQVSDIGILTLDSMDISRFTSKISDADQLFYPSSVSYDRVFVVHNTHIDWMKIQNIQETILQRCASKLSWIVRSPDSMATNIIAAGLIRKNILTGSPNTSVAEIKDDDQKLPMKLRVVLNAMMYYGKINEFTGLISQNDLSDKIKLEIADWAFFEAVDYKRIISDRTVALFQGSTSALAPLAEDTIYQGIKLFRIVNEYLKGCCKYVSNRAYLQNLASSVKCMFNHTKLMSRFINVLIVPLSRHDQTIMRRMHEDRKSAASKNKTALPVQLAVRNMHRISPDAQFWNDLPYDDWYPPTPLDLLESILNISISERIKREVVIQYILDWLRANPNKSELSDVKLAVEVIQVMTNQMLDVDLEKILYVLDQEKTALTRKANVTLTDDRNKKHVFSLEIEELTYDQLWSGEAHLASTINSRDLERFQQRLKLEEDKEKGKLPIFDSETEKLYQVFLFEKQKYRLMSSEAVQSHNLLNSFLPTMLNKTSIEPVQKSSKELSIEKSVKEMFEKHSQKEIEAMPQMFAKFDKNSVKKRKSDAREFNSSPISFVPPTAKRIQQKTKDEEDVPEGIDTEKLESVNEENLNRMIATPARYYKRPVETVNYTSPSDTQKMPFVPQQNSILKTAKTVQSPSRGRIRFDASVRKGANESIDSIVAEENEMENAPKKINFAILEDAEEEETRIVRKSRSNSAAQETEKVAEVQFEVLEEHQDVTFELQDDEDNQMSLNNGETFESISAAENLQTLSEVNDPEKIPEVPLQNGTVEVVEQEYEEHLWDGVHRSFEAQNEDDCGSYRVKKLKNVTNEAEIQIEAENDPAVDVPLDRTFEAQEEEETGPLGDTGGAEASYKPVYIYTVKPAAPSQTPMTEEDRPPSANTRSRKKETNSRSATPVENENEAEKKKVRKPFAASVKTTSETRDSKKTDEESIPKKKMVKKSRNRLESTIMSEDERHEDEIVVVVARKTRGVAVQQSSTPDEIVDNQLPSSSRTRVGSEKRNRIAVKREEKKPVPTPRTRSSSASRSTQTELNVDSSKDDVESSTPVITGRITRSRANSRCQTPSRKEEVDKQVSPTRKDESSVANPKIRAASVVPKNTPAAVSSKKTTRVSVSAPSTPRRGRSATMSESEDPVATNRGSTKRRNPTPDDTPREDVVKKTRGCARTPLLKVIPESTGDEQDKPTDTPKRGRSRTNSVSSSATTSRSVPTTPKRGRKAASVAPTLEEVVEEHEPVTPTRRSARRLQQKP